MRPALRNQGNRRPSRGRHPQSSAFTLVELLVVVSIIGLLIMLLMPAIQSAREAARRGSCANNQKQVGVAIANYEGAFHKFPKGRLGCDDKGYYWDAAVCSPDLTAEEKTGASGFVDLLPQLEQQAVYDMLDVAHGGLWNRNIADVGWYSNPQKSWGVMKRLQVFVCPSDDSEPISRVYYPPILAATGSYAFCNGSLGPQDPAGAVKYGNDGLFLYVIQRKAKQVEDGLSNTLMLGEVKLADTQESSNTWTYTLANADCLRSTANPLNTQPGAGHVDLGRRNGAFGSQHPAGAVFAFADGHVDFLADDIEFRLYQDLSTIAVGSADAEYETHSY